MSDSADQAALPAAPVPPSTASTQGAVDISEAAEADFREQIAVAQNEAGLRQIADEIVSATGYGVTHVLSTSAFAHTFALSGLHRAANLAQLIEARAGKVSSGLGSGSSHEDESYHGYRDALSPVQPDD